MAQLLIRNLPDSAKAALRDRAEAHGRSMEAEARRILVDVVMPAATDPVVLWLDDAAALRAHGRGDELPEIDRPMSREVDLG